MIVFLAGFAYPYIENNEQFEFEKNTLEFFFLTKIPCPIKHTEHASDL